MGLLKNSQSWKFPSPWGRGQGEGEGMWVSIALKTPLRFCNPIPEREAFCVPLSINALFNSPTVPLVVVGAHACSELL